MDFETTLSPAKQLNRVSGKLFCNNIAVRGYEIHMGITSGPALQRPAIDLGDRSDGVVSKDGQIVCSYLHGLFDHPQACNALLQWAGLNAADSMDYELYRQKEIDRVAEMLATEINLDQLAGIIGINK